MKIEGDNSTGYERLNTYYYHGDHLGSAQLITDFEGMEYEHIEYTPYGELWIEEQADSFDKIPFRFTGKELDKENKLFYYGARYFNPQVSRWMSVDPAGANLVNPARRNFFITESLNWYTYCTNNPVDYTDSTGMLIDVVIDLGCIVYDLISLGYHAVKGDIIRECYWIQAL